MNTAEMSQKLFDEGLQNKRQGNYARALELYKKSIEVYPQQGNRDLSATLNAMGKAFYLNQNYKAAVLSYETALMFLLEWQIVKDMQLIADGHADDMTRFRFMGFLRNPAKNIGHALLDPGNNTNKTEVRNYIAAVSGHAYDDDDAYQAYDEVCR